MRESRSCLIVSPIAMVAVSNSEADPRVRFGRQCSLSLGITAGQKGWGRAPVAVTRRTGRTQKHIRVQCTTAKKVSTTIRQ